MSDDQPTRDLDDQADDDLDTVELRERWRGSPHQRQAWRHASDRAAYQPPPDETRVIPDDLGIERDDPPAGQGRGLTDTQPINLDPGWHPRSPQQPPGPATRQPRQPPGWTGQAEGWGHTAQPYASAGWEAGPPIWQQPAGPSALHPLPEAGRTPDGTDAEAAPRRSRRGGQHLLVWVFTLLLALGLGITAVLGPWTEPLQLSAQASALLVVVVSLLTWTLLSPLLRLAGVIAFVFTPLLLLAGDVPELRRVPVDLPQVSAGGTVVAMALGLCGWLAGHWYFYARKGWWRSRLARAILTNIPGVDAGNRPDA